MNLVQNAKYNMYVLVEEVLAENHLVVYKLPGMQKYHSEFSNGIKQVKMYNELQYYSNKGLTVDKKMWKETLIVQTVDASDRLYAFAQINNNTVLMAEAIYTEVMLRKLTDVNLLSAANGMQLRTAENLAVLIPYGASDLTQSVFLSAIEGFASAAPKPRKGIAEMSQYTRLRDESFVLTDKVLDCIDNLMELLKRSNVNLYESYWAARKVLVHGKTSLSLRGLVRDAETKVPVSGARIEFLNEDVTLRSLTANGAEKPLVKFAAEKGGYYIRSLATGVYMVRVTMTNYEPLELRAVVDNESLCVLIAEISKLKR